MDVHFADAPGALPAGARVRLVRDDDVIADADALVRCFAPQLELRGWIALDDEPAPDEHVVICSNAWPTVLERVRARLPAHRISVLLHPADYVWGYSHFARLLPSWPDWPANRAITPEDARTHVTELAKLRIVDGRLRNADPDTLTHFQRCAREHATEVAQVREHLADDESRTVLDALVHGSIDDLFTRYLDGLFRRVQYFDCGTLFPGMTICNGGIQEGFELPYFIAHTGGTAKIVCIDPGGFERLSAFSRPVVERFAPQFSVVPYALWSSAGDISLPITETGEVLSQLKGLDTPFREIVLPCRTLDEIVEEQQIGAVDLVKLDVEGAEPEVWAGMQRTLAHRPQIAISIYHWPRHFWEIPLALMDRLEDYDYYLRHYAYGRWECVLFAVPRPGTAPRLDAWRDRDRAA